MAKKKITQEEMVANSLRGTLYETVTVKKFKVDSDYLDTLPRSGVKSKKARMIHTGWIEFDYALNQFRIDINHGFFALRMRERGEWVEGSPLFFDMNSIVIDDVHVLENTKARPTRRAATQYLLPKTKVQ